MPQQQQQRESSLPIDKRTTFNLTIYALDTGTACFRPGTRSHMGPRGLGGPGFWAMLAILFYAVQTNSPDMLCYWYLWMGMAIYRRLTADPRQHTHFQGFVWPFAWCVKNEMTARLLEVAAMPFIGGIVSGFSEDVGYFITTVGTFSFAGRYVIDAVTIARRKEAAHNAVIEMEHFHQYFQSEG